ncbi:MAG: diacylglycerol kinase family lipid kinase [Armatimonadota bacterium]|nr:diacylglycerol kinase family lipid kinase [Armatimonadota bacterium]MCX7776478.1 diacylglycerol kinase family lipid kinase [Armatimonadota bacterium]MDW8024275.1 diacylglycerol kinase family lipid kinase [Armatimonadota bacterium]
MSADDKAMRLLLIINPVVAQTHEAQVRQVVDLLRGLCKDVEMVWTAKGAEVRKAASSAGEFDRVVVVGGDGTINEVANIFVGCTKPLAVIPLGTGNTFATNFGIPMELKEACQTAIHGKVTCIDVGQLDGRYFVCVAGVGFDAHVLHQLQPSFKRKLGKWAYAAASIWHLVRYRQSELRVRMDHEEFSVNAWLTVASNVPTYALNLKFAPQARPDDGHLDVCIFFARSKLERLMQAALSLFGYHIYLGSVVYRRTRCVELDSQPPVWAHVDGEPVRMTPVNISILPRALNVVVPHGSRMS